LPPRNSTTIEVLALVTDAFGGLGGIAQYNRDLATALAQCSRIGRVVILPRQGTAEQVVLPEGVRQLAPRAGKLRYTLSALRAAMREGPFHVVFCGHLHMAPLGAVLSRALRVPLWLQLHGFEAWGPIRRTQLWAAERAALVTVVSRYTRRRFLTCARIDPSRVRVLPNTFQRSFAPGPKPDYLLKRHQLHGKKTLLTVGRLAADERGKGQDKVIEILPRMVETCPELVYIVAGTGDDRARLERLAHRLGIAGHVLFVGMVAPHELADYYRLADVFVMPSTQEGFGIVFLEAAASGLKLIGGRRDGSTDALADGAIGVAIDPDDADELASAIAAALVGEGPNPTEVRRFRFENFAERVGDLTGFLGAACNALRSQA
jgi:phosphatidylinositol alpha-1,6-mannosyltransferase